MSIFDYDRGCFKVSARLVEPILAIASHNEDTRTFYMVLKSSPHKIRIVKMTHASLEELKDPVTLTEEVTNLMSGLRGILYVVTKKDQILVHTKLDFAANLWKAVHNGYVSCGFISDKTSAKKAVKPTNEEATEGINSCCEFIKEWDSRKKDAVRKPYVEGKHGNMCSADVQCMLETKEAMEINMARMEGLHCNNEGKIRIYTMFSEAHAEHGFGNMPQGTARTLLDFATGLRSTLLNMLLRYIDTQFSLAEEYRKAYMEPVNDPVIDVEELTTMMSDLKPIVEKAPRYHVVSSYINSSDRAEDDGPDILREALNIARSQPRRTTRQFYKESAGYAPQVLEEQYPDLLFQKNDVVAHENVDGTIGFIAVSVNLSKDDFEKHGKVIGNKLMSTDVMFQYECGDLTTVKSKFLLRDRLGSYLSYESGYNNSDQYYYLSETFLTDAKRAHALT